jgi:hypothetical protein
MFSIQLQTNGSARQEKDHRFLFRAKSDGMLALSLRFVSSMKNLASTIRARE